MAYTLNSVSLSTYGIVPGHISGSNIALSGCFDLPERISPTHYIWAEDNSIEPYVAADELFFAGRDIVFKGMILGANTVVNNYLKSLYAAIQAFTGLVVFATPYGSFSVQVKTIKPTHYNSACSIEVTFREPVVTLTGGTLPASGINNYTIDRIPFTSFGLYLGSKNELTDLPDLKPQYFTKYASEGYQITKYGNKTLSVEALLKASGLSDFQDKVKNLYLLFSSAGTRNIKINDQINIDCFATEGFKIEDIMLLNGAMIGVFKADLTAVNVNYLNALHTEAAIEINTEESQLILI